MILFKNYIDVFRCFVIIVHEKFIDFDIVFLVLFLVSGE